MRSGSVSTLFTENKSSRFLKSACDVGFMAAAAVRGAEITRSSYFVLGLAVPPSSVSVCICSHVKLYVRPFCKQHAEGRNLLLNIKTGCNLTSPTMSYISGKKERKKKNIHSHLVTARKWGGSTLETEQYQYLRSASLIPSKQAVIGMFAVIFHVSLLISPLRSPIILSRHLNTARDAAVKRGKLFAIYVH